MEQRDDAAQGAEQAEQRAKINEMLDATSPTQVAEELIEISARCRALKRTYAELRRAKNTQECDRLLRRAPVVDLPDILGDLAERTAGAVLAVFRAIEVASEGLDEYEDEYEDEDADEDGLQMPEEAFVEARQHIARVRCVVGFLKGIEGVPDDVLVAVRELEGQADAADAGIKAALGEPMGELLASRGGDGAEQSSAPPDGSPTEGPLEGTVPETETPSTTLP